MDREFMERVLVKAQKAKTEYELRKVISELLEVVEGLRAEVAYVRGMNRVLSAGPGGQL